MIQTPHQIQSERERREREERERERERYPRPGLRPGSRCGGEEERGRADPDMLIQMSESRLMAPRSSTPPRQRWEGASDWSRPHNAGLWLVSARPQPPLTRCEPLSTGRAGNLGFMTRLEFEWKQQNYSLPSLTNKCLAYLSQPLSK